jgi:DNA repair exonuclease SbcCD ATPase subunit
MAENDLETTAELPVLDVAAYEAATSGAEARTGNTDTWIVPSQLADATPAEVAPPTPNIAAAPAVSPPVADERRTQLEVSLHALSDNLREVEERLTHKGERLSEIEKALANANAERSIAEQRSQQLTAELARARATIALTEARVAELQRGVEERDANNNSLLAHEKEFEEKLALRDKAISLVQKDLTAAQVLAATYLESLQSTEGRRGIFQEISSSLYWEVDERDARIRTLEGELAAATGRARQLEARLDERVSHIAKLEQEVNGLGARVSQHQADLKETTRSGDDLKRSVGSLTESLASREERIRSLEGSAAQQATLLAEREAELAKTGAERTTLIDTVNSLESKLAAANTRNAELETTSRTANSRAEELEVANGVQRKRVEQLEVELGAVRTELQQRSAALQEAGSERGEHMAQIAAGDARVKELEGRIGEQHEFVRVLQADSNASIARAKELENDLSAAEDMINRLETDLRSRITRLDELEKTTSEWRATVEEARAALTDRDSLIRRLEEETANSAVLLGAIQQRLDSTGTHEIAPDGDKRLLIRAEGDSEVVHVLSRKTSVGRTPDNDLQIDAKYISRHHAVILAGPAHTIIEDLNSTNGVLVNGRRITRQTLKDGDAVVIGKTVFRFAVRQARVVSGV